MKLHLVILFISGANAFTPKSTYTQRPSFSSRFMQDTSDAVQEATKASETFGKTSPEARTAWNNVEELDAANSHEKAMREQIEKQQAEIERLQKTVAEKVTSAPTVHTDTSDAVKHALEASRMYGKTSVEARMAWDLVEELDAANSHHRADDVHIAKPVPIVSEAPVVEKEQKDLPKTLDDAINAAMLSTKIYGAHATDSQMAWELVEEMESATSHKRDEVKSTEKHAKEKIHKPKQAKTVLVDTSAAITAALETSKKYGKSSVEARMAWEAVDEMDAANAHHQAN
eukprot:scaffold5744_cov159-Amphora_coffeaeformis.AAC.6